MDSAIPLGKKQIIDGQLRVYYYGYWIKAYEAPADTLLAKKRLIEALTRRLFNHVEHGINVPGKRLDEARRAFESEADPQRKRVKGAMLAGAIFNRAADIFTKLVEIQELGVTIEPDNALMRECGEHLLEALTLGKMVLHRSGEEGLDELWGEPFKAFSFPVEAFYNSRYVKIAQSMKAIDGIRDAMIDTFGGLPMFAGLDRLACELAHAAKVKCETLRTDAEIFEVWTSFVVSAERLAAFQPLLGADAPPAEREQATRGVELIVRGKNVISYIARARVPMPKTTSELLDRYERYRAAYGYGAAPASGPARSVA
ncbi:MULTISPECIES: hypothetical protein [Sorangium]|uniref:Uncharacterized protein n=1 Tax=Sorangium cellulosum TaxID=56 RepID=A0A4P2R0A7_SORCE|nr:MULTISPECIES: hypothetical protein [Sorangium]AUX36026.1 hypothetical protein SOCE836_082300 [Sorangium cellulosum]WCQ95330.1 hypothetical protein NQZ70_08106 [Sorangium sp. Soce836]